MTTFALTTGINNISAGEGTDIFQGPAGGLDTLLGNGGNDLFNIQAGQMGRIDGGTGYDRIHMTGSTNNEFASNLTILGVDELIIDATNLFTTAAQLRGFTKIGVNNSSDQFHLFLQGAGGRLDFSRSYTEPQRLTIEAEQATSAVTLVGSAGHNEIIGSDFADRLSGHRGDDTIRGGGGNDVVNGGLGRDHLFGDDGIDAFLFDSAPSPGNLDRLGDFRPADDVIRLENAVFNWAGQTLGVLPSSAFKVIGNGQQVDANDRILYNQNTGAIFYDVDGNKAGGVAAVAFAVAENFSGSVPALTFQDFVIV